MQYDPNSFDAKMSEVLTLLREQSKRFEEKCEKDDLAHQTIMAKQDKTNGRVTAVELFISNLKGKVTVIATAIPILITAAGWVISKYWING